MGRGGGKAGGGFDGSNSTFHSLSRFNGRGDQSRDGVIHRDKPIPEEARRKQHCKLCYPRPASSSPALGRLLQEVPWEPDPLGSVPGKAWPSWGWAACTFPGGVNEVGCNPTAPRSRIWGRMFGGASGLPCACDAPERGGKIQACNIWGSCSSRIRGRVGAAFTLLLGRGGG